MAYPLPDPSTPAGTLYLDSVEWAHRWERCGAHPSYAEECEVCRGELTVDELTGGVDFARRDFRRWIESGRPSLDQVAPAAFGRAERYGLALLVVAVDETVTRATRWVS